MRCDLVTLFDIGDEVYTKKAKVESIVINESNDHQPNGLYYLLDNGDIVGERHLAKPGASNMPLHVYVIADRNGGIDAVYLNKDDAEKYTACANSLNLNIYKIRLYT